MLLFVIICNLFTSFWKMFRPFLSSPGLRYQNEVKCSAFVMKIIFHSHANKTHFQRKGCALGLVLKVKVFGTRKWLICCTGGGICNPASPKQNDKCLTNPRAGEGGGDGHAWN